MWSEQGDCGAARRVRLAVSQTSDHLENVQLQDMIMWRAAADRLVRVPHRSQYTLAVDQFQ